MCGRHHKGVQICVCVTPIMSPGLCMRRPLWVQICVCVCVCVCVCPPNLSPPSSRRCSTHSFYVRTRVCVASFVNVADVVSRRRTASSCCSPTKTSTTPGTTCTARANSGPSSAKPTKVRVPRRNRSRHQGGLARKSFQRGKPCSISARSSVLVFLHRCRTLNACTTRRCRP